MHPAPWFVLSSLAVCACSTNEGRHPDEQTRTEAQTLRSAVELYRAQLPDASCPMLFELVDRHMLAANSVTEDRWGNAYVIRCVGDDIIVTSNGPDGVLGSPDDIR